MRLSTWVVCAGEEEEKRDQEPRLKHRVGNETGWKEHLETQTPPKLRVTGPHAPSSLRPRSPGSSSLRAQDSSS